MMTETSNNLQISGQVLQMVLDDIKGMKHCLEEHTKDEVAEFRRIYDRIEALDKSISQEMQDTIIDVATLKTKMRVAAWVSGGIASLFVNAILIYVQTFLN